MSIQVVGRQRELELVRAALASGAHILIEGPPGTGKSTLLRQVAESRHTEFVLVEGSAELTPARLIGSFDPALVLEQGYRPENFSDGPLVRAMRGGGLLYVEELNRVPEETINVLLTVMSEGEINVPRLGRVPADPSFRLVAAMNPYDSVGTSRLSTALYDRTCRISVGYQDAETERQIVRLSASSAKPTLIAEAVDLARATREHPDLRSGASVRGAIDYARLVPELAELRAVPDGDWQAGLDAALTTLSGRVRLHESCRRSADRRHRGDLPAGRTAGRTARGGRRARPGGMTSPPAAPPAGGQRQRPRPKSGRREARTDRAARARPPRPLRRAQPRGRPAGRAGRPPGPGGGPGRVRAARGHDRRDRRAAAGRRDPAHARPWCSSAPAPGGRRRGGYHGCGPPAAPWTATSTSTPRSRACRRPATEARPVAHDDLTTVQWARPRTAFAVVVDRSGSMSGGRLAAAATVAAACALRAPQEHAVLSFAGTVDVIRPLVSDIEPAAVAERLLRLRGHGVTRLAAALQAAGEQLAQARARAPGGHPAVRLPQHRRGRHRGDRPQPAGADHPGPGRRPRPGRPPGRRDRRPLGPVAHPLEAAAVLDRLLEPRPATA